MEHGNLSIFESGAMVQYLLDKYGNGQLVPDHASADYAYYLQWFWFAEATFARPLGDIAQNTRIKPPDERIAAVIPDAEGRALLCLQAVEAQLAQSNYLVGSKFTAADIMMGYTLHLATGMGILNEEYARTMAYLDALKTRPGFQSALIA